MNDEERRQKEELLAIYKQNLEHLEKQIAMHGIRIDLSNQSVLRTYKA